MASRTLNALPAGLTRGYGQQFLDALNAVPGHKEKVLTIQELDAMDHGPEGYQPVKSEDETA